MLRQPKDGANKESAQNLAAQIDEPGDAGRRTRYAAQVADACNFPQLFERQPVHFGSKIEPEVRHALLVFARLRIAHALLLDCGKDGFRIHAGPLQLELSDSGFELIRKQVELAYGIRR